MSFRIEGRNSGFKDPTALFAARDEIREQRYIPNPFIGKPFIEEPEMPTTKPTPPTQAIPEYSGNISDLSTKFRLNDRQIRIFTLYLQGINPSTIAELLGIGRINASQAISDIRIRIGVPKRISQEQAIRFLESATEEYSLPENLIINDKQRTILELYLNGVSNEKIGETLNIATEIVNYHIKKLRKLFTVPNGVGKPRAIEFIKQKLEENPNFLD